MKHPPRGLTLWFQARLHSVSESLGWVRAPGHHLVCGEQGLDWAMQGSVKSSHEYF